MIEYIFHNVKAGELYSFVYDCGRKGNNSAEHDYNGFPQRLVRNQQLNTSAPVSTTRLHNFKGKPVFTLLQKNKIV